MAADSSHQGNVLPFRQLRLRPKTLFQTQTIGESHPQEWQFCAAIEGRGLMLAPMPGQRMPALKPGTRYCVQGFTGQYDFSFDTALLGVFDVPFAYALMSYPPEVNARLVRQALRVRTLLPAKLMPAPGQAGDSQASSILDLSLAGALIETLRPAGDLGTAVRLSFVVDVDSEKTQINADALICHRRELTGPTRERVGLSFRTLPKQERLLLSLYLHTVAADLDS